MQKEIVIEVDEKSASIKGFEDEIKEVFSDETFSVIEKKRVSRIVPKNLFLRAFFYLIRFLVSDESKIAEWTRNWKCKWIIIIGNQKYGNFTDRKLAVMKEKKIIRNNNNQF